MYGYTDFPHQYNDGPTVDTWEILNSYDGGVPTCRDCGLSTEVHSVGSNSTIVCTNCNVAAKINTRNLNHYLAQSKRAVFPIKPRRNW